LFLPSRQKLWKQLILLCLHTRKWIVALSLTLKSLHWVGADVIAHQIGAVMTLIAGGAYLELA